MSGRAVGSLERGMPDENRAKSANFGCEPSLDETLGKSHPLELFDHDALRDFMAGDCQVAPRMRSQLLVFLERQLETSDAAHVAALAQERPGKPQAEFEAFLGDAVVDTPKDVLRAHL